MAEYDNFKVMPTVNPDGPARQSMSPAMAEIPGQQLKDLGDATQQAGKTNQDTAYMMQDAVNQVKVLDARNQAMQQANDLRFNTDTGFTRLKGSDALQPIEGQAMPDYYASQLNTKMQKIAGTLTNPMQQRMFQAHAGEVMTGFRSDAESHMMSEFKNFHTSAVTGAMDMSVDDAIAHADNPVLHEKALENVSKYAAMASQFTGASALEMHEKAEDTVGAARLKTITNMRDAGNLDGLNSYYAQHHDDFGIHKLDAQNIVNDMNFNAQAIHAGMTWAQQESQRINPTAFSAYHDALFHVESGSKDYNDDGTPVKSGTGALYKNQVLPSTAAKPGYGIKPAADQSPEEYNRVGEDLLKVAMKKFPDKDMVTAAYHDGIAGVESAIAKAGADGSGDWQKYISDAARDEVAAVDKRMAANLTAQPIKSHSQAVAEAVASLGPNPSTVLMAKTLENVNKYYDMIKTDQSQRGDQLWGHMQQQLMASNGDMSKIDPIDRQNLAVLNPGASLSINRFAEDIARGGASVLNTGAFADVYKDPDKYRLLQSAKPAEFNDFLIKNFPKQEQEKIIEMLDKKKAESDDPGSLNATAYNGVLNRHLQDIGINGTKPDDATKQRINDVSTKLINGILSEQKNTNHKMNMDEIEKYVSGQFAKNVEIGKGLLGGAITKPLIEMTAADIPDAEKVAISDLLTKNGIPKPTEAQVLGAYLHWKSK